MKHIPDNFSTPTGLLFAEYEAEVSETRHKGRTLLWIVSTVLVGAVIGAGLAWFFSPFID